MNRTLRTLGPAFLLVALCASACGDARPTPDGLKTTTLGDPESAALTALAPLLEVAPASASDDDADLLVVDGDDNSPGTLAGHARVRSFLNAGKSVLFLDMTTAHHDADLIPLLHGASQGEAHAILARKALDPHGRPEYFVYAFPRAPGASPTDRELDAFVAGARSHFERASAALSGVATTADDSFDPPPGLLYVLYNFTLPPAAYEFTSTKNGTDSTNGTQWTSLVPNYRFTLMLENGKVATGDRQFVVSESSAESSPLNSAKFSNHLMIEKQGSGFVSCDVGWFQVELDAGAYPQDQSSFVFQTSSPENTNQVTTVNSRISFGISFLTPKGIGSSFAYQSNDSTDLTAWEVVNAGNDAVGLWMYKNQDPWIWNEPDKWNDLFAYGHGVDIAGSFALPNTLAADQLQAVTKIVWATNSVLSTTEAFTTTTNVTYLNVWAPAFGSIEHQAVTLPMGNTWTIDMQAVVPIPIAAITFSRNPVDARDTSSVTATVQLESPAAVDTVVYLTSDSPNATVPPSVTVRQGDSSAAFAIDVNANGLTEQQPSTTATIQAFDALSQQAQLTITRRRE